MERPSARLATGWYTGAIAPAAAGANGAARWPATKWMPARAGINAPNPHTGGASVSESAVLRHLLRYLILCWFRLFSTKMA